MTAKESMVFNLARTVARLDREMKEGFKELEKSQKSSSIEKVGISLKDSKRVDVMVDIETLGVGADSFIFQIAATEFDIMTGDVLSSYNGIVDLDSVTSGEINTSTLKWWTLNHTELFKRLIKQGNLTSYQLARTFREYLLELSPDMNNVYLWGNGILFDNNMIKTFLEYHDMSYPIHFRNDRDVRTIFELAQIMTGKTPKEFRDKYYDKELEAHDAFDDCINQSKLVAVCFRIMTIGGGF